MSRDLTRCWIQERPDVVHAHFWMSGIAAVRAGRALAIPIVQTFHALGVVKRRHQGAADTSPPERLDLERRLAQRVDAVLATCTDEVFELLRLGVDRRRIAVAPCGVDLDVFRPEGPSEGREPGRHRLLSLGRMVPRKGVGDVIEALAAVPHAELVVAGGPPAEGLDRDPEARRLAELATRFGVRERVRMRGSVPRPDVPALLRSADAVVCAPWYEPFGIVPLEAMACGVPVVATAVGGQIDSVVHDVTGVHVPPRRPDVLAEALRDLLGDPDRRRTLGAAGAHRARERFGWDRIAGLTLALYQRVAGQGRRGLEVMS
jgi:glycosyltransferase involved in cell wall biosynthesis